MIVLDINDIEGSYPGDLVPTLNEKMVNVTVVLNKSDTLPAEASLSKFKVAVIEKLQQMTPAINNLVYSLEKRRHIFCLCQNWRRSHRIDQ
jgi:hypothetical protein